MKGWVNSGPRHHPCDEGAKVLGERNLADTGYEIQK